MEIQSFVLTTVQLQKIVNILRQFSEYYEIMDDQYRAKAYSTAAVKLLIDNKWVIDVKNPGSIDEKIAQFAKTGTVDTAILRSADFVVRKKLAKIMGVGPKTAAKWADMGIKTIRDINIFAKDGRIRLTKMQTLGLKYRGNLATKIPRDTVKVIAQNVFKSLLRLDPGALYNIAGSYRRNAAEVSDIDLIISANITAYELIIAVNIDIIAIVSGNKDKIIALIRDNNGIVRQLDILNVPKISYPAALLYFTGDWEFNVLLRNRAKKLGYKLNHLGLFSGQKQIKCDSEEVIFAKLGLKFIAPNVRNAHVLSA